MNAVTVYRKLDALGETADRVADSLRRKGIKGRKTKPTACPIANYLIKELELDLVIVSPQRVEFVDRSFQIINFPDPIVDFIYNFDNNKYPFIMDEVL